MRKAKQNERTFSKTTLSIDSISKDSFLECEWKEWRRDELVDDEDDEADLIGAGRL